jgi:transglutaminase-like putative cysteine protease
LRLLIAVGALLGSIGIASLTVAAVHEHAYRTLNAAIAPAGTSPEERVLRTFDMVSQWEYFDPTRIHSPIASALARLEHAVPLHLTAWSVLNAGVDHIGPCGSTSRAMIVLLRVAGIPARKAILYGPEGYGLHTVVEVSIDGEWRVFDPSYGYYWRREGDGQIATVADLARDDDLLPQILEARPHYPIDAYRYGDVHRLRWEKVPPLGRVRGWLAGAFGADWVRGVETPHVYERPYLLFGLTALGFGMALVFLGRRALGPRSRPDSV